LGVAQCHCANNQPSNETIDEEPIPLAKSDNGRGSEDPEATALTEDLEDLSISEPSTLSHTLSPLSPFTGDVRRDSKTFTDEQVVTKLGTSCPA
jgi:hypothetical protein